MEEGKKDNITIANWLMIVGFFGLAVMMFFGLLFGGVRLGFAIGLTVVFIVSLIVLLILSIKFKAQKTHTEYYLVGQILCLVAALAISYFCLPHCMRSFYVASNSDQLKKKAEGDIDKISALYSEYELIRKQTSQEATTQLTNFLGNNIDRGNYPELNQYCQDIKLTNIDDFKNLVDNNTTLGEDKMVAKYKVRINNWNYFDITSIANYLVTETDTADSKSAFKKIQKKISEMERGHLIPLINKDYKFLGYKKFDELEYPSSDFADDLRKSSFNLLGFILYAVFFIFIVLTHSVAEGGNIRGITNKTKELRKYGLPLVDVK